MSYISLVVSRLNSHMANDWTCKRSSILFSNYDAPCQLNGHTNAKQISISLLWKYTSQQRFYSPKRIFRDMAEVSLTIFLSVHFILEPPQSDFTHTHTHTHTHSVSSQTYTLLCALHTRTHIYTHYIDLYFLTRILTKFWTFEFVFPYDHNAIKQKITNFHMYISV